VLNREVLVGTQFWSLAHQAQRASVSAGPGVDKGEATASIERLTVTLYNDTSCFGSLETNLVTHACNYCARPVHPPVPPPPPAPLALQMPPPLLTS